MGKNAVKFPISPLDAKKTLYLWIEQGLIPFTDKKFTKDDVDRLYKTDKRRLVAICHKYLQALIAKHRQRKQEASDVRSFYKPTSFVVYADTCMFIECDRPVFANRFCVQHTQEFLQNWHPNASKEAIQECLRQAAPRRFTRQGVVVSPVNPVTPPGAETPDMSVGNPESNEQSDQQSNDKPKQKQDQKKSPQQKTQKKPYQEPTRDEEVEVEARELAKDVTDNMKQLLGAVRSFVSVGYGAPVKPKKRRKKNKKRKPCPCLKEVDPYGSSAHTNLPHGGAQSYFSPYTAAVQLMRKQAKIWNSEGMSEKDIRNRMTQFLPSKKRKKKKTNITPSKDHSPEQDKKLLTVD